MNDALPISLIENAGLLVSTVLVFDFLTARRNLFAKRYRQTVAGLAVGCIGVAMIYVSVTIETGVIFDTRTVLLAVAGRFLGVWPTLIAMLMTAVFRLSLGGVAAWTAVAIIIASGAIGIAWRHFRGGRLEDVSWRDLYALGLVVHAVLLALLFTLPGDVALRVVGSVGVSLMVIHPLATVALGLLVSQRLREHGRAAELSRSESRFRLLAENARDLIFRYELTPERRFSYVSPSSTSLTGYTPEEHYADRDLALKTVHPDDRARFEAAQRGDAPPDRPVVLRRIRKGGEIFWSEERFTFIRDDDGALTAVEGIVRDITRTRRTEEQLHLALKAANQGVYDLNVQTGAATVSDEYARMLGHEPDEFHETYAAWIERMHPDDRESVSAAQSDYIAGRAGDYRVEFRQRTRAGEWVWVLSAGSIVSWDEDGKPLRMLGTHTDITALKTAEQDLLGAQHELRRLTQILEATQAAARVGGWEIDLENDSLSWTAETFRIHDVSPSEYTPSLDTALAFFTAESLSILKKALQVAIEHGVTRDLELELISFTGRRKWVHFTTSVSAENGRMVRVPCAVQDITARKQAERERVDLTTRLHQSQKLESLGSLAGGVAHDINNVLAAILSLASAHRKLVQDSDPLARSLDTIVTACVRGRSVVRSLLYFARTDVVEHGPVDINAVARDIVHLLESTTLKRFRFPMELQEPLPGIDGDEGAISHAVMNLCLNAVDAMPDGGAVSIRTRAGADGSVEISVRDTGTGMTPDVREKAIEPFFTTKPLGKGSGLGLATVYGTMTAHKGTLEITSAPGEGTEVTLRFPGAASLGEDRSGGRGQPLLADHATAVRRGLRILLVDDDELIRDGVAAVLEMGGHKVYVVEGGAEAIARFESGLEVDVVILDMNMPGMSGAETLPRLLSLRPRQAVLISSGHGDEEMIRLTAGRGNVSALKKPFTMDELEEKLAEMAPG